VKKLILVVLSIGAFAGSVVAGNMVADNIAGYEMVTVTNTHTQFTLKYSSLCNGAPMPIQRVIPGTQPGLNSGANANPEHTDLIILTDDTSCRAIYYLSNGMLGDQFVPTMSNTWVKDGEFLPSTDTFTNGTSFWFISQTATNKPVTLTFTGQVDAEVHKGPVRIGPKAWRQ